MSAYYNAAIYIFLNYLAHSSAIFLKSNMMIPEQIYCITVYCLKVEICGAFFFFSFSLFSANANRIQRYQF